MAVIKQVSGTTIHEKLEAICRERHIKMADVAQAMGISSGNISSWKANDSRPSLDRVYTIADYYNVSMDWLCGRTTVEVQHTPEESEMIELFTNLDREGQLALLSHAYAERRRMKDNATNEENKEAQR